MRTTTAATCGDCGAYIRPGQQGSECPICGAKPIQEGRRKVRSEGRRKMQEERDRRPPFAPTAMLPLPYSYLKNPLLGSFEIFFTPRHPDEPSLYFAGGFGREADVKKAVALLNSCGYVPEVVRS